MREVKKTVKAYLYSELEPSAQQFALDSLLDVNIYHDWWDAIYTDAEDIGLAIKSYDDYAIKGTFTLDAFDVATKIHETHYVDTGTYRTAITFFDNLLILLKACDYTGDDDIECVEDVPGYTDLEEEFLDSLCEDYRIMLRKEFEYLTSEESLIESIEANGYEFLSNGEIFNAC